MVDGPLVEMDDQPAALVEGVAEDDGGDSRGGGIARDAGGVRVDALAEQLGDGRGVVAQVELHGGGVIGR